MADEEDPRGGPRCAFLLLTAAQAQPDQTSGWQVDGLTPSRSGGRQMNLACRAHMLMQGGTRVLVGWIP